MIKRYFPVIVLAFVGLLMPLVANALGSRSAVFLPSHWPALLAGLSFGSLAGGAVAAVTALADVLWGSRTPGAAAAPMAFELVTYGMVAGALGFYAKNYVERLQGLGITMFAGRAVYLVAAMFIGRDLGQALVGMFVAPWPGIVLQLLCLPALAVVLRRWTFSNAGKLEARTS